MRSLERRIVALEAQRRRYRTITVAACEMTDIELLDVIAPSYRGPLPTDDDLRALLSWSDGLPIPDNFGESPFLAAARAAGLDLAES